MNTFLDLQKEFIKKYFNPQFVKLQGDPLYPVFPENITYWWGALRYGDGEIHRADRTTVLIKDIGTLKGVPIYLTSEQVFRVHQYCQNWYGLHEWWDGEYIDKESPVVFNKKIITPGIGYGFFVKSYSLDGHFSYIRGHCKPAAQIAKDLQRLLEKARIEKIDSFMLPKGVEIARVGMTGDTDAPHLHYEVRDNRYYQNQTIEYDIPE